MDAKTLARFWTKVDVAGTDDCWLWTAARFKCDALFENQYGQFRLDGKPALAHRVSYMIAHGDYPAGGLLVLHGCHNPPCVNPVHLHSGTHVQNMVEMVAAGRSKVGEKHSLMKLTESKVLSIRALDAEGVAHAVLAQLHDVHQRTIRKIVNRERWQHI